MMRAMLGRQRTAAIAAIVALVGFTAPAFAQTGMVKGKVVDAEKKPVDGAKVVIEFKDGINRKFEVKTNKRGDYIQIGLQPGNYEITASKDGVGTASQPVKVGLGDAPSTDLTLAPASGGGGEGPMSKEETAFRKVFNDGVAASKAGNQDEALKKFQEALQLRPDCYACQYNIAGVYLQKKDDAKAEEALLAASKLDPNQPDPYNALASLYNGQKKYDKAAEMAQEAAKHGGGGGGAAGGGSSAETLYNQGVVLWNAGKAAEARTQFEAAVKAKPDYADAYYWIGMANLNEGKMPEAATAFDKYLQLAPSGQYAEQAKGVLSSIKK